MPSNHYNCLTIAQTQIRSLNLSGLSDDEVIIADRLVNALATIANDYNGQPELPCCFICPAGPEEFGSGENNTDDIIYGVQVVMVAARDKAGENNLDRNLQWRESILDHFHENNGSGFAAFQQYSDLERVTVTPYALFEDVPYDLSELWVSGLQLNFMVTKVRRAS